MVDRDLAELYGVELKKMNQAAKRNIERFPADWKAGSIPATCSG
jgi:hypothetical protein